MRKIKDHELLSFLKGELAENDRVEIEIWLEKNENQEYFDDLKKIWNASNEFQVFNKLDVEAKLIATKANISQQHAIPKITHFPILLKVAASIVTILTIGIILYLNQQPNWIEITSEDKVKEFRLPDGSIVSLNRNSTLRFLEDWRERTLELEGEAFFEVKKDPNNPFTVKSKELNVKVLGTSFNVNTSFEEPSVTVTSGKVQVQDTQAKTNYLILKKGDAISFDTTDRKLRMVEMDRNYLSWRTNKFYFENQSVLTILQTLAKHKNASLNIPNLQSLESCMLTIDFENQSLIQCLEEIKILTAIDFKRVGENEYLVQGKCKNQQL